MTGKSSRRNDPEDQAFMALLHAIASRKPETTSQLLAESPRLATRTANVGATREEATTFFFEEIAHYAYAGDTALHFAAASYQRDIASDLISKGANPRARNRRGAEPLHYAADGIPGSPAWNPEAQYGVIDFLINAGADPNSADKSGVAPLHRAVRTRCAAAVRALLDSGADLMCRNGSGSTPLHLAVQDTGRGGTGSQHAREQQKEIIQLLLERGARVTDKDTSGRTVEDCATAGWIHVLFRDR